MAGRKRGGAHDMSLGLACLRRGVVVSRSSSLRRFARLRCLGGPVLKWEVSGCQEDYWQAFCKQRLFSLNFHLGCLNLNVLGVQDM